jgi:peptidoglycan hydrolase CwlO-like protein
MGEKYEGMDEVELISKMAELELTNDALNERNQKLAAQIKEMGNQYQELSVTHNKADRLIGKMLNKIGLYQAKLMRCEVEMEDMAAEIKGYKERARAAEVPADGE